MQAAAYVCNANAMSCVQPAACLTLWTSGDNIP